MNTHSVAHWKYGEISRQMERLHSQVAETNAETKQNLVPILKEICQQLYSLNSGIERLIASQQSVEKSDRQDRLAVNLDKRRSL